MFKFRKMTSLGVFGGASAIASLAGFLQAAEPVVTDRTLYITAPGKISLLSENIRSQLDDNTITNVSITFSSDAFFTNDVNLSSYQGAWHIGKAWVRAIVPTNAFGIANATDEDAGAIWIDASKAGTKWGAINFEYGRNHVVDKPIFVTGANDSSKKVLLSDSNRANKNLNAASVYYTKRVEMDGSCQCHFQGPAAKMYFDAGLTNKTGYIGTIGAGGQLHVRNVPCRVKGFLMNSLYFYFYASHNYVQDFNAYSSSGALVIHATDAFDQYPILLQNFTKSASIHLYGNDLTVGKIQNFTSSAYIYADSGSPTFAFSNLVDMTTAQFPQTSGAVTLSKAGSGKLTIDGNVASTGSLIVRGGPVVFTETGSWPNCKAVTLSGGTLACEKVTNLPADIPWTVSDASADSVVTLAADVNFSVPSFTWGSQVYSVGSVGSSAATRATVKCGCFSSAGTGILQFPSVLTITVDPKEETLSLYSYLQSNPEVLTALGEGFITKIVKTGAGVLNLDYDLKDFDGIFEIDNGKCVVKTTTNPLGVAGTAGLDYVFVNTLNGGSLHFGGSQNSSENWKTFSLNKPVRYKSGDTKESTKFWDGTVTTFLQPIETTGTIQMTFRASMIIKNGMTVPGNFGMQCACGPYIQILEKPISVSGTFTPYCMTLKVGSAGNQIGYLYMTSSSTLNIDTDNPFLNGLTSLGLDNHYLNSSININMNGHDFDVRKIGDISKATNTSINNGTKYKPATFRILSQEVNRTNDLVNLTGPLSFSKAGTGTFGFNRTISAVGGLSVTGGRLDLCENARWPGATNVMVSGSTAVLGIANSEAVFKRATLSISAGGKLNLASNVRQSVGDVYLDGKIVRRCGTYGSSASNARYKNDTYFSGPGVLLVHSTVEGTVFLIR